MTVVTQKNRGALFPLWSFQKIYMDPFYIFIIVYVIGLYKSNDSDNNSNNTNNITSNSNNCNNNYNNSDNDISQKLLAIYTLFPIFHHAKKCLFTFY